MTEVYIFKKKMPQNYFSTRQHKWKVQAPSCNCKHRPRFQVKTCSAKLANLWKKTDCQNSIGPDRQLFLTTTPYPVPPLLACALDSMEGILVAPHHLAVHPSTRSRSIRHGDRNIQIGHWQSQTNKTVSLTSLLPRRATSHARASQAPLGAHCVLLLFAPLHAFFITRLAQKNHCVKCHCSPPSRTSQRTHHNLDRTLRVTILLRNVSTKERVALHRYEMLTVELSGTLANTNSEATHCAPRTDKAEMSVRLSSTFMLCLEIDQHQMVRKDPGGAPPKGDSPTPVSGTVRPDGQTM